jgi:hypothetical protein
MTVHKRLDWIDVMFMAFMVLCLWFLDCGLWTLGVREEHLGYYDAGMCLLLVIAFISLYSFRRKESSQKERRVFLVYCWVQSQQAKHFERNPVREWIWYKFLLLARWLCNVTNKERKRT